MLAATHEGDPGSGGVGVAGSSPATYTLIAINALAFLVELGLGTGGLNGGGTVINDLGLRGTSVADGEYYRILTGGFLHAGLLHIGFNMFALYVIGRILEPGIGTVRFVFLYFASLLAGSLGALLLTDPGQVTVGASGAIFGIFGAMFVIARARGLSALAGEIGVLLLINLALTFGIPGISIGGHLGGLIGGMACALVITLGERGAFGPHRTSAELGLMALIGLAAAAGCVAVV